MLQCIARLLCVLLVMRSVAAQRDPPDGYIRVANWHHHVAWPIDGPCIATNGGEKDVRLDWNNSIEVRNKGRPRGYTQRFAIPENLTHVSIESDGYLYAYIGFGYIKLEDAGRLRCQLSDPEKACPEPVFKGRVANPTGLCAS